MFPEGAVNHLCGIAVSLEDSSQVLALLGQSGGVTDLLCSGTRHWMTPDLVLVWWCEL